MGKRNPASEPSQRQRRVGEQLKHIIAETLRRGHFGHEALLDLQGITVTEVLPSPDLKYATAYIVGDNIDEILPLLDAEAHVFQKDIGTNSNLKFTPRVRFRLDESFENAQRIDQLLGEVHIPKDNE